MTTGILRELRLAWRGLLKRPFYTAATVLTLALGLGATTAMFSVVNGVLLEPMDLEDTEELMWLWSRHQQREALFERTSEADLVDWQSRQTSFRSLVGAHNRALTWTSTEEPRKLSTLVTTSDFFEVLGVRPVVGRTFRAGDEDASVVLLAHRLWSTHFGGAPEAVGSTMVLDGEPHTVVGVLPVAFELPRDGADVYQVRRLVPETARSFRKFWVLGRLRDDISPAAADQEMQSIAAQMAVEYPKSNRGWSATAVPLRDHLVRDVRAGLWALFGAVGLVLLIACVNVAHLLLLRAHGRRGELAIRRALGAGRAQLAVTSMAESALLAVAGAGLGILLARGAVPWLLALEPGSLPRRPEIAIDGQALLFACGITFLTTLLCGAWPALRAVATNPARDLGGARSVVPTRRRGLLITAEVAFALLLLTGAGLLVRSFEHLVRVNPGFDTEGVAVVRVFGQPGAMPHPKRLAYYQTLEDRLRQVPGVRTVGGATALPLSRIGLPLTSPFMRPGDAIDKNSAEDAPQADVRLATPGYLPTLGVPLLRGRHLAETDRADGLPVVVINETLARQAFPGENPLGQRLRFSQGGWMEREVVGVVGDVRFSDLVHEPRPEVYIPFEQHAFWSGITFVVGAADGGTAGGIDSLLPSLRRAVLDFDRDQPPHSLTTMAQVFSEAVALERFAALLLSLFAALALVLTAVGIYAVVATAVAARTREMGLRRALGAQQRQVSELVLRQTMEPVVCGLVCGLALSFLAGKGLSSLLHGIGPRDPATLFQVCSTLVAAALFASWLPAWRAAQVDPAVALRDE